MSPIFSLNLLTLAVLVPGIRGSPTSRGFSKTMLQQNHVQGFQHVNLMHQVNLTQSSNCQGVDTLWYTDAVVDNFAEESRQTKWSGQGQRYFINKQSWGGTGYPVFVYIGGEGEERCERISGGMYFSTLATTYSALVVDIEHRYYGQSIPTTDQSLTYLSAWQALADLARLLTYIKVTYNVGAGKIIMVGGSYPGNLAAWFRLKYPDIAFGAIASSAPLIAEVNFFQYMEVCSKTLAFYGGDMCPASIKIAAEKIALLGSQGQGSAGWTQLSTDFNSCKPMYSQDDYAILMTTLMGVVQGTVQYNMQTQNPTVSDLCQTMAGGADPYTQFVQAAKIGANGQIGGGGNGGGDGGGGGCYDYSFANTVSYLSGKSPSTNEPQQQGNNDARSWTYQVCNEFGYLQTLDSPNQPFYAWKDQVNLAFYSKMCLQTFGITLSSTVPMADYINKQFGGINITATNVLYVAGSGDPWSALGLTDFTYPPVNPSSQIVEYIIGSSHCQDMGAPKSSDSASLTQARTAISTTIAQWLS